MERYLLGDLSGIEMREAQKSLLDAEERILSAQYNTKVCEISLQQISGNIFVLSGITPYNFLSLYNKRRTESTL